MRKNETTRHHGVVVSAFVTLIGLYCGGMTAVTRSRRAFASFSKLAAPSARSFHLPSPPAHLISRASVMPHRVLYPSPISAPRVFIPAFQPPRVSDVPKLNTADDSRAPSSEVASEEEREGERRGGEAGYPYCRSCESTICLPFSLFFCLFFSLFFYALVLFYFIFA